MSNILYIKSQNTHMGNGEQTLGVTEHLLTHELTSNLKLLY